MLLTPPRIIVTGLSHSGLRALSAMLTAGGALHHVAADPHLPPFKRLSSPACGGSTRAAGEGGGDLVAVKTIGLWLERDTAAVARSALRHQTGESPASHSSLMSLVGRVHREFREARAQAARMFAPLFTFQFEDIVDNPARQADRLLRLFSDPNYADLGPPACPLFDARAAALAIRRIAPPPPKGHPLRLIRTLGNA
jgi:hypothetical protein